MSFFTATFNRTEAAECEKQQLLPTFNVLRIVDDVVEDDRQLSSSQLAGRLRYEFEDWMRPRLDHCVEQ